MPQRSRRIILLEQFFQWLGGVMVSDLGRWLARRLKSLMRKEAIAHRALRDSGHTREFLT